jgi:hypothetical protein
LKGGEDVNHTYHRTSPSIVFDTVAGDLPELERLVDSLWTAGSDDDDESDDRSKKKDIEQPKQ